MPLVSLPWEPTSCLKQVEMPLYRIGSSCTKQRNTVRLNSPSERNTVTFELQFTDVLISYEFRPLDLNLDLTSYLNPPQKWMLELNILTFEPVPTDG